MKEIKAEFRSEFIKPEEVKHGDTIILDCKQITVSREHIKKHNLLDNYTIIHGHRKHIFERVLFPIFKGNEILGYTSQKWEVS